MGTGDLWVVRCHRRYYVTFYSADTNIHYPIGSKVVRYVPTDPDEYHEWLKRNRASFAFMEANLDVKVYEQDDKHFIPDHSDLGKLQQVPSELPLLSRYQADNVYIMDLDREVLTINYGIHWKLANIPRQDKMWARAGVASVFMNKPTISLDLCPEEHMASLALELPVYNPVIGYEARIVRPRTAIHGARKAFHMHVLATLLVEYKDQIVAFGREWNPDSFPFRELTFAILSIARGDVHFYSNPPQLCPCAYCTARDCDWDHSLDEEEDEDEHISDIEDSSNSEDLPDDAPGGDSHDEENPSDNENSSAMDYSSNNESPSDHEDRSRPGDPNWESISFNFGTMYHRPGQAPGASPMKTRYWLGDVLINLTLVVDGNALTNAVAYGTGLGRTHFQLVVMSLFDVTLAEVSTKDGQVFVRATENLSLSPLRPQYCTSTHPRERPELKPGMTAKQESGETIMRANCTGTTRRMRTYFPGLAALVNFFDAAEDRRLACRSTVNLAPELWDMVLDYVDYDTFRACKDASQALRASCLRKFRLDDNTRLVAGPFVRRWDHHHLDRMPSFNIENMQTGEVRPVKRAPVIGCGDRSVIAMDVSIDFVSLQAPCEMRAEDDSDDDN
ncbi:uncharacterized protein PG986_008105 [Apiospora aurea]|uniref:F-box domain-containing protein n=1 Tax=Apiospora aurea TaxID=335848 RepID=A0ABR1QEH9_9PEZI